MAKLVKGARGNWEVVAVSNGIQWKAAVCSRTRNHQMHQMTPFGGTFCGGTSET